MANFEDIFGEKRLKERSARANQVFGGEIFSAGFDERKRKINESRARQLRIEQYNKENEAAQQEANKLRYRIARAVPTDFGGVISAGKKLGKILTEGEQKLGQYLGEGGLELPRKPISQALGGDRGYVKITEGSGEDYVRAIDVNNRTISKWRELVKKNPERQERAAEAIRNIMEKNVELAQEAGGEVKDITNRQIAAVAAEVAVDFATAGGETILAKAFKGTTAAKVISPLLVGSGMGAIYGATGALMEKEAPSKKGLGISVGLGALFGLGLAGMAKGLGKIFKKPKTEEAAKISKKMGQEEVMEGAEKLKPGEKPKPKAPPEGVDVVDWIRSQDDIKIEQAKKLGNDLEGNEVASRLEWDYKKKEGTLYVTPKVTKENLAHETGHYMAKAEKGTEKQFLDDITAITGGKQNINEDFAQAVRDIIQKPEAATKAPKLAEYIQGRGIKLPKQKIEESVVQILDKKTGKVEYKTIKKGELEKYKKLIDYTGKEGIAAEEIGGKVYHLTAKTPKQMEKAGAIARGMVRESDIPKKAVKPKAKPKIKPKAKIKAKAKLVEKVKKAPTVIQNEAKKTYKNAVGGGKTKPQAQKAAVKKVIVYEKKVDKLASKNAVINSLIRERRGTTPRKRVKTTGINWSKVNTSEGTEKILDKVFHDNKQFKGVRPSRTNQDIVEGARMVNIDPNDKVGLDNLLKTMPNANTAHKLKQMMVDSASDLKNYIDTVGDFSFASREQLKILKAKFMRTQSIAKAFSGMRTESSHLLRSMGIEVIEGENDILAELGKGLLKASKESGEELNIDTLSKFMSKSNKMVEATLADKALAIWYNSILSGWKTWTRNIMDTGLSLAAETLSKVANPLAWKEAPGFVAGLIKNLRYSIPDAVDVLKGKRVVQKYTTRGATYKNTFKNKWVNAFFELSGRVLDAQDVVYSGSIKRVDNGTTKFLKKHGIGGDMAEELNKAIKEQFAERVTYRNKPLGPIGKVSGSLGELTNKVKVLKLFAPFTKVVANVLDRKVDYMPFLNLMRTFNTGLTKNRRGGYRGYLAQEAEIILRKTEIPRHKWDELIPVLVKRLKHQQLGRLYLGTMVTIGAQGLAQKGLISGDGPSNLNQKRQLQATGWRPFSVKVGNYWIPYKYFGPLSGILAANGSIADEMKYNKKDIRTWEKIVDGLHGFAGATLDQSFMSGISGFFELMTGKINKDRWARNFFTGIIPYPALSQQTQSAIDGKSYDIQTMTEAIGYKFGFYKNLTPRLTALGEEIRSDLIYGITPSKIQNNLQAEFEKRGVRVNLPATTTKLGDESMTREQLWEYTKLRGEKIKKNKDKILKDVDNAATQEKKEKAFKSWIDAIGEDVKNDMKKEYKIKEKRETRKPTKKRKIR